MTIQSYQLAALLKGLPFNVAPSITGTPYIGPDQQTNDTVDFVNAPVSVSFPPPTNTDTVVVNGTSRGFTPYTITSTDVTQGNLGVIQSSVNSRGSATASSSLINPVAPTTAWIQNLLGGNAGGATDYSTNQFLNNGGQAGFYPFYAFNNTGSAYSGGIDGNGWPTAACTILIAASIGGLDGQLLSGTYLAAYRSVGQATTVSAFQGCTVSGITHINPNTSVNDGVTTYFTLTIPFAQNPALSFNGAIQYLDIPRDFATLTYGGPEFWATMLAFYSQFSTLRLMDVCRPNFSTEVVWADRLPSRVELGPTQPGTSANYSWDRIFRLINAITSYTGSRTKKVGIALPGLVDPTAGNSTNYAFQLATLMNTVFAGNPVEVEVELADEPWNFQFNVAGQNTHSSLAEMQGLTLAGAGSITYSTDGNPVVSSVVSNGDGTATVTTTAPLNAIPLPDGTTFAITNGLALVVNNQTLNALWGAGSVVANANVLLNAAITTVNVTVSNPTGNTFIYPINGGVGVTNGTVCPATQMMFIFNSGSNLVTDGLSLNLYQIGAKRQTRRLFQVCQVWKSVRPQDNFMMNLQQYTGSSSIQTQYPYSQYIAGTLTPWAYASAVAPYVKATSSSAVGVSGNTFLTNVPFAATSVTGDVLIVSGIAAAGGTFTGSITGATLTASSFAGPHLFVSQSFSGSGVSAAVTAYGSATGGNGTYTIGTVSVAAATLTTAGATFTASVSGTTMTVSGGVTGTALGIGQTVLGTNVAAGTTITGFGSGSGGNGTYTLSSTPVASAVSFTTAGTTGTTTVAAGSSGTTLNIADKVETSTSLATITAVSGPQANFTGYIIGTTLTVTATSSGTVAAGMIFNGTPATMAFGTKIVSGSGTSFQVSISQTIGSVGTPVSMVAANTDGILGMLQAALPSFAASLGAHIYQCNLFGFRPMCYEGGTDTQLQPTQQVAINTNPLMGPVLTGLYNAWFSQGGKEFQNYFLAPSVFTNSSQGEWPFLQSFSDLTSPRIAAVLAYSTQTLNYANPLGNPGIWQPSGSAGAYVDSGTSAHPGLNFNAVNGMVYSSSSAADRYIDLMFAVPRTRRYAIVITGSSSAADVVTLYLDGSGTPLGTVTMVPNGAGSSNATVPAASAALQVASVVRGVHRLRIDLPIGVGANAGFFSVQLVAY